MARDPTMARDRNELFVASFLMLFVELVLIRWAGAYVVYLSYFANFILLGSFLGIGVGFLRARREPDLFRLAPMLLVLFVGVVKALPVRIDRTGGDLVYFGVQTHGLPTWVMLPFIFLATAAVMASIAHGVAARFSRLPALDAYRADIIGSICGIAVFSLLALLGGGPVAWGVVVVALFVVLLRRPSVIQVIALAGLLVVFVAGTFRSGTIWSPYYRLDVTHHGDETAIDANGVPHQTAIVTTGSDYEDIYKRLAHPPGRVLVVGAGNGNDVAVALEHGATHVDAVEIDPEIQKIGVQFHPQHPYQDPRVTRIIADGRAYLERTHERYDLIIFALPDSLTLVAGQSAIRLESFLFTLQAFQAAHDRLAPGGSFAIYNFYREQWLADRLAGTMADVFGQRPCLDLGANGGGSVGQLSIFIDSADASALNCATRWDPAGRQVIAPAVDDRPFPYLKGRTIPSRYLLTVALILLASAIVVRLAGGRVPEHARLRRSVLHGRGVPAARDEERGPVRVAVRDDLVRERLGVRWRAAVRPDRDRGRAPFHGGPAADALRAAVDRTPRRLARAHRLAPRAGAGPAVPRRDRAGVLPDLRGEPDLRVPVPGHGRSRPRRSAPTSSARCSAARSSTCR